MIPYLEVKGSHREIGQAIGEETRIEIRAGLKLFLTRFKHQKKDLSKELSVLSKIAAKYFPNFWEEVKGIAEGSGEKLQGLISYSFEEEISPGEHCTAFAIRSKDTIYFAHNEDWNLGVPYYIVKAKPKNKPSFLSVSQAGQFPCRMGMNDRGLVFSDNSIGAKINFQGLPKNYLLRSFLECSNLKDVKKNIARKDRTLGANAVLVSKRDNLIATLEWSHHDQALGIFENGFAHSNHYILNKMKKYQDCPISRGSKKRYLFAEKNILHMKDPELSKIKGLLKTHFDTKIGICQHGQYKTLVSVIVDAQKGEMMVSSGNPCKNKYNKYFL